MNLIDRAKLQDYLEDDLNDWLKHRSSASVVDVEVDTFRVSRQLFDLNRKSNDQGVTSALKKAGVEKLHVIQERIRSHTLSGGWIAEARHLISQVLPPLEHCWEEVWDGCGFGPGTVYHARGAKGWLWKTPLYKIGGPQSVTPEAYHLAVEVIATYFPNWAAHLQVNSCSIVRGNRIAHVPKDVKKCRTIAVEPSLNVFLQKGIGEYLIRRLRQKGVANLRTGQQKHREIVSAEWQRFGTIDLSDASDSISTELIRTLLPEDWFALLDATRSKWFQLNKEWYPWESFSSQGNAFTFPLETLVFWAIAKAASHDAVMVYGDDIIAPTNKCALIVKALHEAGFETNVDKSYWGEHPGILAFFRESCGMDTLFGRPVRSVYFKDPANHEGDIYALMNRLYECWGYLPRVHEYLSSLCKRRFCGPRQYSISDESRLSSFLKRTGLPAPREYEEPHNSVASGYSDFLWFDVSDLLGWERPKACYDPHYQTLVYVVKYMSVKTGKLRKRHLLNERAQILAFLYGFDPKELPKTSYRVRTKVLTLLGVGGTGYED